MKKHLISILYFCILIFSAGLYSCSEDDDFVNGNDMEDEELQDIINPQYVPVDWTTAKLLMCDTLAGKYVMTKTVETSQIKQGSVLVVDMDTTGLIIRVNEVVDNANEINLKAERGTIADIFANIDFTLSTSDDIVSRGRNVFYPEKIICRDNAGQLMSRTSFSKPIWEWSGNFDGTTIYRNSAVHLYYSKANMNISYNLDMHFNFGQRGIGQETRDKFRAEVLEVEAALVGAWDANFMVQADVSGTCTYDEGEDLVKHNLIAPISIKFLVFGVPVWIDLTADLYRHVKLTCEGEASAYTGISNNILGKFGFNWKQQNEISKITEFENNTDIVPPTITGSGRIDAKVWLYPRVRLTLYGIIGPSFDIKPYIGTEARGGFKITMGGASSDFFAWSLRNYCGVDFNAGLSLMFMNYETKRQELGNLNIIDKDLYKSPYRIELSSAPNKVNVGESANISFVVKDYDYIFNRTTITPLAQIIKFESSGALSNEYGITNNGIASVTWIPSNNDDILYGTLYDYQGEIIDRVEYSVANGSANNGNGNDNNDNGDNENIPGIEVDLGLPSGTIWASWNVGASSPEEYGGYYAWGETEEKDNYTEETYKYGIDKYGTGYVDDYVFFGLNISGTKYDVARQKWGGSWRMPTKEEFEELLEKCTWTRCQYNSVWGQKVTGPNGNSIFLPAAGRRDGTSFDSGCGYYYSATLTRVFNRYYPHWFLNLERCEISYAVFGRGFGCSVRPVK